jgi:ATP/ADP translocase
METLFSIYRKKVIRGMSAMQPDKVHLHMLVYSRIICKMHKRSVGYVSNSMTSPVMWLMTLITVFPAIVLRENTLALIGLFAYFSLVYIYIYSKIIHFSTGIK